MKQPLLVLTLVSFALGGCGGPQDEGRDGGADLAKRPISDLSTTNPSPSPGGCSNCPSGFSCGSANGVAVCKSASGIPAFTHVFVIVMENTSLSSLQASTNTPFLHGLPSSGGIAMDYHGVTHPSLPNYIAMTSGDSQGISCDCDPSGSACSSLTCNTFTHSCGCPQSAGHIGDQLDAAGKTWKDYAEDMGTACNTTGSTTYALRHVPFLYYTNMAGQRCTDHVVDYGSFAGDLAGATPVFNFIAPNLDDDMHGTGLTQTSTDVGNGDQWLMSNVPAITSSAAFASGGVLFIVWDEDDLSGLVTKDAPIPLYVLSPYTKGGTVSPTHADHYALLATIEDGLGLPRLGQATNATPLADFFQ